MRRLTLLIALVVSGLVLGYGGWLSTISPAKAGHENSQTSHPVRTDAP